MFRFRLPLFIVILAILASSAGAAEVKIGYADLQKALNTCEAGVKAKETLKEEAKKFEKELDRKQETLKKLKEEIDRKKGVWNSETLKEKTRELQQKSKAFQKMFVEYNDRLNEKKRLKESEIIEELRDVVAEIAREKGYTHVFEKSSGGLLYAPAEDDLTEEVIKKHNKKFRESEK